MLANDRLARELAKLADRHETRVQAIGKRGADDETAPFQAGEFLDAARRVARSELFDHRTKTATIREQGGEVVIGFAWPGIIGNFPDEGLYVHSRHFSFGELSEHESARDWPDAC